MDQEDNLRQMKEVGARAFAAHIAAEAAYMARWAARSRATAEMSAGGAYGSARAEAVEELEMAIETEAYWVARAAAAKQRALLLRRAQGFMSRAQFRKLMERAGVPLRKDQDVAHLIARANGGADHRDNYFVASRSLNQSLGKRNDAYLAEVAGLEQTKKAVAVSRTTGYKGPGAEELIAMQGKKRQRFAA